MRTAYATMIALQERADLRFVAHAYSAPNSRTGPTIAMFRELLAELSPGEEGASGRRMLVIQYDDFSHHDVKSVAFCRRRGEAPAVRLVPDAYFFHNRGYEHLRAAIEAGSLPPWEERRDVVFWRGTATNRGEALDGSSLEQIDQIPRVALGRLLAREPAADAAIIGPWGFAFPREEMVGYLVAEGVLKPAVPMLQHGDYRYLVDIDGVANAWGFFEKLLLGCCILKVGTPFEQWFYRMLREWRHYVPVRPDLSDLVTQIEWVRSHPRQASDIAGEAQRFALAYGFATARRDALSAVAQSLLCLDG